MIQTHFFAVRVEVDPLLPPLPVLCGFVVVAFDPGRQRSVSTGEHRLPHSIELSAEVEQVGVELSAGGLEFLVREEEEKGRCVRGREERRGERARASAPSLG